MELPLVKNSSEILTNKAIQSLELIRGRLLSGKVVYEPKLLQEMFKSVYDIFSNPNIPVTSLFLADTKTPIFSTDLNRNYVGIYSDLSILYKEVLNLGTAQVRNYNYNESRHRYLSNKVSEISSNLDAVIERINSKGSTLVFIEEFKNTNIFNEAKLTGEVSKAAVLVDDGFLSLKPISFSNAVDIDRVKVINLMGLPSFDYDTQTGGFEGLLYNTNLNYRAPGSLDLYKTRDNITKFYSFTEGDIQDRRKLMLDNNPDTFWECELTIKDDKVEENVSSIETETIDIVSDPTDLEISFIVVLDSVKDISWISVNPNTFGRPILLDILSISTSTTGNTEDFEVIDSFFEAGVETSITSEDTYISSISPETTKNSGQAIFSFAPREAKFIKFRFRQKYPYRQVYDSLEVLSATSKYTKYTEIDYATKSLRKELLFLQKERTLLDARTTISSGSSIQLNVPVSNIERVKVTGSSVDEGTVLDLRFENSPDFVLIENIALTWQEREIEIPVRWYNGGTLTVTAKNSTKDVGTASVLVSKIIATTSTVDTTYSKNVTLPLIDSENIVRHLGYLESLYSLQDNPANLISISSAIGASDISKYTFRRKSDILRYAIGIRSIDIFSYRFDSSSEFVSKEYTSDSKIVSVKLDAIEIIPAAFSEISNDNFIKYYISVDEGSTWYNIMPIYKFDSFLGDYLIPKEIFINSDLAPEQRRNPLAYIDTTYGVYSILVRVVLNRPPSLAYESYTPLLKRMKLFISVERDT